ncbi:ribokinase [Jeotgalibaca porci]|uniref:Ribokinase n=1 Tax=Jeotgalibaca porci TaxID=1868793 RepID=A0A6G7WHF3_9LACT|nr:ribokinase [Jeotgalibaca porci]QIK51682.1 ribokinase [Jeotgalibaca porci]
MSKIMVIGSISTDFVVLTDRRPQVGETVTGNDFQTTFGGKGANQAVASARLGGDVSMVGTVGTDVFGSQLIQNLADNGIVTDNVERVTEKPSGSAHITIADGDNSIVYIPGANNEMTVARIEQLKETLLTAAIVIVQNELPQAVIDEIITFCFENDIKTIYNPAPARVVAAEILEKATYFTPNESEFHQLFPDLTITEGLEKYPNQLILTMGSKGVYFNDGEKEVQIPSYKVVPVDTTGAGDTFNGAFAVALSKGMSVQSSIQFGNLAASLSIQKMGAQGGMPTLEAMKASEDYEKAWDI